MPRTQSIRTVFSVFCLVVFAWMMAGSNASAQTLGFNEIPVPTNSAYMFVWSNSYYQAGQVVIRQNQQAITFDTGSRQFTSMRVRPVGGQWITIYQGSARAGKLRWNSPPTVSGQYEVSYFSPIPTPQGATITYPFGVAVVPSAQRAFVRYETVRYPNATIDSTLKHTILVWTTASAGGPLDKLLLVVEGIDAANESGPEAYYAIGAQGGTPLFPTAQQQGGDIAILNFGDGGRDMRANAAVVDAAVTFLRTMNTAPRRSIDVAGVSMGGVVARYALAKMEQESRLFGVGRFVSIDAPQRGAIISTQLQYDIRAGVGASATPPALTRLAALQLLRESAFDPNTSGPNSHHNLFYNELRALNGGWGYPHRTENVGVSFGTPDPNPNSGVWLRLKVSGICNIYTWTGACNDKEYSLIGATDEPGSYLPRANTEFFGTAAWGLVWYYLERITDPTFIPYTSALDIASGTNPSGSRFDAPVISAAPDPAFHNEIQTGIANTLLKRLGYGLPSPPSVAISGPASVAAGQTGYWRAFAPDMGAGYQFTWEYQILFSGCGGGALIAEPGAALAPTLDVPSASELLSGPPTQNLPPCAVWNDGSASGSGPIFAYRGGGTSLELEIRATATNGSVSVTSPVKRVCIGDCSGGGTIERSVTGVSPSANVGTAELLLRADPAYSFSSGYPNPFGPGVGQSSDIVLRFTLPDALPAHLVVYDALGREVARPYDGLAPAGETRAVFDAATLPSGTYVVRLTAGTYAETRRVTFAR